MCDQSGEWCVSGRGPHRIAVTLKEKCPEYKCSHVSYQRSFIVRSSRILHVDCAVRQYTSRLIHVRGENGTPLESWWSATASLPPADDRSRTLNTSRYVRELSLTRF